ncbi:MAG TPA: hypothetical protein VMZ29_03820 [Candidatus Bathyarchaeia archaeon]|nr:hypothetical protein [Candidatus Bathyarchaeia archaeon]
MQKKGLPFCETRKYAQTKNIDICSNCSSFDNCEKIKKDQWQYELLLEIKEKGYRNWLAEI